MIVETALRNYLLTLAPLTALVSTRIYNQMAPQNVAFPFITIHKPVGERTYAHCGPGLSHPRMQVSCFGRTYAEAKLAAKQVLTGLESWTDAAAFGQVESDMYYPDTKSHGVLIDFQIWIQELI